jgi:hypothetical protein
VLLLLPEVQAQVKRGRKKELSPGRARSQSSSAVSGGLPDRFPLEDSLCERLRRIRYFFIGGT